jgi:hypothetical protein
MCPRYEGKPTQLFPQEAEHEGSAHTEIQYLLLKLGADMGFGVHVASNDQAGYGTASGSAICLVVGINCLGSSTRQ